MKDMECPRGSDAYWSSERAYDYIGVYFGKAFCFREKDIKEIKRGQSSPAPTRCVTDLYVKAGHN